MGSTSRSSNFRGRSAALLAVLLVGCQAESSMQDYKATVRSARTSIPVAVEMERLYPHTDHFITHYGFAAGPKVWNTESYFGDRYHLTMQVEVTIDYTRNRVTPVGKPTFFLMEINKLEPITDGVFEGHFGRNLEFDLATWEKLFDQRGDLTAIGFVPKKGKVEHFWEDVATWRRPRVHVSLLDQNHEEKQAADGREN